MAAAFASRRKRWRAGAHHVARTDGLSAEEAVERLGAAAADGVDHVVEVAFHANVGVDEQLLGQGGSIATFATGRPEPAIPFWPLVFKNVRLFFLGSDDFPAEAKRSAARGLNEVLAGKWPGFEIEGRFPLDAVADVHAAIEERSVSGRVVLRL